MGIGTARDVYIWQAPSPGPARSDYLEQVRGIAPPELHDRDSELAELARFCLDPDGAAYAWWRAGPYAGKSALLLTFVLRPPPELAARGVEVVSFFITAQLAAQDTREAFMQAVSEQLAELLGETLPATPAATTRESHFQGLLERTAASCEKAGGRLVLVVDGLDEEKVSVEPSQYRHSIAGLLPAKPPHGMRIIVAGRPDPPVPVDVPDRHPLHDPKIIRALTASRHATRVRKLSRQELRRLLSGTPTEQNILGLLTAARGGLSVSDLVKLTGAPRLEVEDILDGTAGRTFIRRAPQWSAGGSPEIYLLGHQELQATATDYLEGQLDGYRNRLHEWAAYWRDQGWPAKTPEYLLSGYYQLLADTDLSRMTEYAHDMRRHDRLREATGGDAAALAETRSALDRIAAQDDPDLPGALAVAAHRDLLAHRNSNIPAWLPAAWAAAGQFEHAKTLANSINDPATQAEAKTGVARELAAAGLREEATTAAREARAAAQSVHRHRDNVLADTARALAAAGVPEEAIAAAESIVDRMHRPVVLADVATRLVAAGLPTEAVSAGRQAVASVPLNEDPYLRAVTLTSIASRLAGSGLQEGLALAAQEAVAAVPFINDSIRQTLILELVVSGLARCGLYDQASDIARSISNPYSQKAALAEIAKARADGLREPVAPEKRTVTRTLTSPFGRTAVPENIAEALSPGHCEPTTLATLKAETASRILSTFDVTDADLACVARALAAGGLSEQSTAVVLSIADSEKRTQAVKDVVKALAAQGLYVQATALARTLTDPFSKTASLALVARTLAAAGLQERAVLPAQEAANAADAVTDPNHRAQALAWVAQAFARAGLNDQAALLAQEAVTAANALTYGDDRARALAWVAQVFAGAGLNDQAALSARDAARVVAAPHEWCTETTMASVAQALIHTGMSEEGIALAQAIPQDYFSDLLADVARKLARAGKGEEGIALAASIREPRWNAGALALVALALVHDGLPEQGAIVVQDALKAVQPVVTWRKAEILIKSEPSIARALGPGPHNQVGIVALQAVAIALSIDAYGGGERIRSLVLPDAVLALADAGMPRPAASVARRITDPGARALALARVLEALGAAEGWEQAAAIARSLADPDARALCLARLVKALAGTGETKAAARVAAVACAAGTWITAAGPVLRLNPLAGKVVVDTFRAYGLVFPELRASRAVSRCCRSPMRPLSGPGRFRRLRSGRRPVRTTG